MFIGGSIRRWFGAFYLPLSPRLQLLLRFTSEGSQPRTNCVRLSNYPTPLLASVEATLVAKAFSEYRPTNL